jgi:hypothetical protein
MIRVGHPVIFVSDLCPLRCRCRFDLLLPKTLNCHANHLFYRFGPFAEWKLNTRYARQPPSTSAHPLTKLKQRYYRLETTQPSHHALP